MKRWREQDRKRIPELIKLYGARCWYCNLTSTRWTVDHIIPLSILARQDNPPYPRPIALACRYCNAAKQDKTIDEYLAWLNHVRFTTHPPTIQSIYPRMTFFELCLLRVSIFLTKIGLL